MVPTDSAPADPKEPTEREKDTAVLTALGEAQCPLNEVVIIMDWENRRGDVFRHDWERKAYNRGRAQGLKALRLAQLDMAKKSVPMATMLGRLYLGQTEQREQDETAPIDYAGIAERYRAAVALITAPEPTEGD